ncbi:hypothetical protein ACNOYE_22660 [Nannocystaceae bacterium ST9]
MTGATRIAVLRIPLDAVGETRAATEGWSTFEGRDGTSFEIMARGDALLVRFEGEVGGLSIGFGELWRLHEEPRGVAVHSQPPAGDGYDQLVEGASWEGSLFAQAAASLFGGGKPKPEPTAPAEGEAGEGEAESSPFDGIADQLMSVVAKRSSRKVLAARLAADKGDKDLGDVLDAMEAAPIEGDEALTEEVEKRFAFDPEHSDMAKLLGRSLESALDVDAEPKPDEGEPETPDEKS